MNAPVPDWVADRALAPVWTRIRARLEGNGVRAAGRVRVDLVDRDQRHALGALLGRSVTSDRVYIDLAALDDRLRHRSGVGGVVEVVTAIDGAPPRDRRAERAADDAGREAPLALARELVAASWGEAWVSGLRRTGLLTRRADAERLVADAVAVLEAVTGDDPPATSRVELAARVLGDAHALDEDRLVHQLVLRGLAAAAGRAVPATAAQRRELWETAGVAPDLVSRTCLTWRVRPVDDPVHVTAWDLRLSPDLGAVAGSTVLVCENPRVLEAVAERGTSAWPVVCTSGEPNTVVTTLLTRLVDSGATLRYHGDFDWAGIAIANRLMQRCGVEPWLMSASDYLSGFRPEAPRLTGLPVDPLWDPELGAAMRTHGRAVHEESVLDGLLAALPRVP